MPKKQKIEEYLRFGQIVRIHGHKCLPSEQKQIRGMITVKGFTDKDAKYTTFEQFKDCYFYRQSLFQIRPRGFFEKATTPEERDRRMKEYAVLAREKMGEYVKFGEDVVFEHVDSHDYLSGSVRCSDGGLGAFKVELGGELTPDLVFKLQPFRSFEKEGDKIKLQSPLRIKNISNRCYISTETKQGKHNIVTTYSRSFTWLIHLHEEHETLSDIEQIRTHDLLLLIHTKNEGYLTLEEPGRPCIKLPKYETGFPFFTSLWEIEKLAVPKVSPYHANQQLGTEGTYSLRQALNNEYLEVVNLSGQRIMGDYDTHEITIKSAKGLPNIEDYLKDKGLIKIGGPKALNQGEIDAGEDVEPQRPRVYREEDPFISNPIVLSDKESEHGFRVMKIDEQSKNQVLFILSTFQVLQNFNEQLRKPTELFQFAMSSRELLHIDETLKKLIAFIKNCSMQEIESELLPVPKLQYICMDLKICQILFSILGQIGTKIQAEIYEAKKGQNDALQKVFNRAYYFIWQIIKGNSITKIYVCEVWLQLILNHAIELEEDTVHICLNEILQNNDDVVTKFLSEDDNQLVKRIKGIFKLKPAHEKFLKIFSASCVSGNLPIVNNQTLILNEFLRHLEPDSGFIFRYEISREEGEGEGEEGMLRRPKVKHVEIDCYISKDWPDERRLLYFFTESGRIDLYQTSNYFIAYLNLLADICYGKNTEAKTFVEKVLQPKRVNRTKYPMGEEQTQEVEIKDILVAILQDDQIMGSDVMGSINLQRAVLRLITFAYIESSSQSPVLRINRYRNLDKMDSVKMGGKEEFMKIMQFIKSEITAFRSFYEVLEKPEADKVVEKPEVKALQIKMRLYTILDLLKSTLINAFWTIEEQQNEILPLLVKILENKKNDILHDRTDILDDKQALRRQFAQFKKEVSMPTPSIEKVIECKALACQLIEIIFDFRFNNLVTESVKFYKDVQGEEEGNIRELHKIAIDISKLKTDAQNQILYSPELWQLKFMKILNKEDPAARAQQQPNKLAEAIRMLIPLMVELSIHKNSRLFFRSLLILKRHFNLALSIKNEMLSLSLFDNSNGSYLSEQINGNSKLFSKLEEESELYRMDSNPYVDLMNFLAWLSECIKIRAVGEMEESSTVNAGKYYSIFEHFNEENRIDRFHQRLIKNTDLHPLLLRFLGLSKQPLKSFSPYAKKVLKHVYRFLTLLVRNFKEAKLEMMKIIDKVKSHMIAEATTVQDPTDARFRAVINYFSMGVDDVEIIQELQERRDCEAVLFLYEMYTDNKELLYSDGQMEKVATLISQLVNDIPIIDYYKSHILDFLRALIYYKDKHISANQSRILAKLQDSKKKNIHYRFDRPEFNGLPEGRTISDLIREWTDQNVELQTIAKPGQPWPLTRYKERPVIILQELTYFITMMNLFSNLVEGRQEVNIGKCRQVHSYGTLMDILKSGGLCYPLKTHLRNYINELYYSTNIEEDLCVQIINLQLPLLIDDLNTLIVILTKERVGRYKIMHPMRYKYFQSYIYLYIEQIAYSINYLLTDTTFQAEIRKQLDLEYGRYKYYLHYFIFRIYERLRWVLTYYYGHKYIRGFLNKITNKMKEIFLIYFKDNALNVFDKSEEKLHPAPSDGKKVDLPPKKALSQERVKALKKRSKKLLHKLVQAEIQNYFTEDRPEKGKNFPLTFFLPYDEEEQQAVEEQAAASSNQKAQNERKIAQKLRMMLFSRDDSKKRVDYHSLKLSKLSFKLHGEQSFVLFMNKFIEQQCQSLYAVDSFSLQHYQFKENFVSFQQYIRIFVEVNTSSPSAIPTDLKIFFFNILLQYIVRNKTDRKLEVIESWNKKDMEGEEGKVGERIVEAQLFLADSNVAELLVETLKNTNDLNLIFSILQFGIAYLLAGNTKCQNSLLTLVKQDRKNELFLKIEKIISRLGKKISTKIAEVTATIDPRPDEFVVQPIDRYDFYDPATHSLRRFGKFEEERDEIEEEQLEKRVFGCLFRFMQLLCECNNISFKNFIREQIDADDQKKNYSINVLNMTTFQIRRLFKVMDNEASKIILPLTDFLNEVVSLPCSQNQLALCETTFFEDLCYMATTFTEKKNLDERGFVDAPSLERLYLLYQNCILIILNILEGNNPELNKAFLNKLDVMFLLRIIRYKFEKLLNIDNPEALHNLLHDRKKQEKHVPKALEDAIDVMIVLLKLQASEGSQGFKEKKRLFLLDIGRNGFPLQELLQGLEKEILKIEIVSTLGKQLLYFPKHPILTKLSDATRNRIMEEVSRSTQREKIKSLLKFKEEIWKEVDHNFTTEKQTFMGIDISPAKIQELQGYMFNLSYFIIVFWFVTSDVVVEYQEVDYYTPRFLKPVFMLLNMLHLGITVLYFILYYKCKFVLSEYRAGKEKEEIKAEEERLRKITEKDGEPPVEIKPSKLEWIMGTVGGAVMDSKVVMMARFDDKFLMVLCYFIVSLSGNFIDQRAFLFYILFYFMLNQNLENVFKAITFNLKALFSVGLLGFTFVYIFCLIFYQTYALDLAAQSDPKTSCYTIYGCLLDLYVSGQIGGSVQQLQPMRFGTDLIYFVFFELLFNNIMSGIMIDTFTQLRTKREEMSDDKKNKCYICGNSRGDLQKNDEKFDDHILSKHFLWNYIYYVYCLYQKNETEYTGLEYQIRVCVDKGQNDEEYIKWIPFGGDESDPDIEKTRELIGLMQTLNISTKDKVSKLETVAVKGDQSQQ